MTGNIPTPEELIPVKPPEKVAVIPPVIKAPDQPIGKAEHEIVKSITNGTNPDAVLHDIAQPDKSKVETLKRSQGDEQQDIQIINRLQRIQKELRTIPEQLNEQETQELISRVKGYFTILQELIQSNDYYINALVVLNDIRYGTKIPEISSMTYDFVDQNRDAMISAATRETILNPDNRSVRRTTIDQFYFLARNGTDTQRDNTLVALDTHIREWIRNPNDVDLYQLYFAAIYERGTPALRRNAADLVMSFYNSEDEIRREAGLSMARVYFEQFFQSSLPSVEITDSGDFLFNQLIQTLGKYIPDTDDLKQKLILSGTDRSDGPKPENLGTRLVDNLRTVMELERQKPGICQILRKEFGIRNFFRYPPEVLIAQYENRNSPVKRGIAVVTLYDNPFDKKSGGAFATESSREALGGLFRQLQDDSTLGEKYGLMIYEIQDSRELVRAVAHARRHSPNKQLSYGIVMGHGSENTVAFGDVYTEKNERSYKITLNDMQHPIASSIVGAFEDNAPIIFNSCSTGKGIVPEASTLGLRVRGPVQPANIKSYSVSMQDGKLNIEAKWSSESVTYQAGVKIQE